MDSLGISSYTLDGEDSGSESSPLFRLSPLTGEELSYLMEKFEVLPMKNLFLSFLWWSPNTKALKQKTDPFSHNKISDHFFTLNGNLAKDKFIFMHIIYPLHITHLYIFWKKRYNCRHITKEEHCQQHVTSRNPENISYDQHQIKEVSLSTHDSI